MVYLFRRVSLVGILFLATLTGCVVSGWSYRNDPIFVEHKLQPHRSYSEPAAPKRVHAAEKQQRPRRRVTPRRVAPKSVVPQQVRRVPVAPFRRLGKVVIDPGHGGKDPGASGAGPMCEKDVNLRVAQYLTRILENSGVEVVSTRTTDRFIELNDRAAKADAVRADLFVSIHADACSRPSVSGSTMYIARQASSASKRAAESISDSFERAGIQCKGIRKGDFRVLVRHSRPAVLVECGYLTNRYEARRLADSAYQKRVAQAIADGIIAHLRK